MNDQNKSQKSESLLEIKVNREFFIVSVLSQFGDATAGGQAEGEVPRSERVIKIIGTKTKFLVARMGLSPKKLS